jgi:hypothetical protein
MNSQDAFLMGLCGSSLTVFNLMYEFEATHCCVTGYNILSLEIQINVTIFGKEDKC